MKTTSEKHDPATNAAAANPLSSNTETSEPVLLKQSPIRNTYWVPDLDKKRAIYAESGTEADYITRCLHDSSIRDLQSHPETITPFPEHPNRPYTPDFGVTFNDYRRLRVEIKYAIDSLSPKSILKFQIIEAYYAAQKIEFVLIDRAMLHKTPLITNLNFLAQFRNSPVSLPSAHVLQNAFGDAIITVREAQKACESLLVPTTTIGILVYHKVIDCDLEAGKWPDLKLCFSTLKEVA